MIVLRTRVSDDLGEKVRLKAVAQGISIAALLRSMIITNIGRTFSKKYTDFENILSYLNRKAALPRKFFNTANNTAPIEILLEKYKESEIRKVIDVAVARKFTRDQLKPENLFAPEVFEPLLEAPRPEKKSQKAAKDEYSSLPPDVVRARAQAEKDSFLFKDL
ncbi:MAG TPA: hypothetical protein DCZ94_21660 [Lentisphaeria bacterium]|nr:MAG: hypothetical protein A2X48_14590 [Lentisphaerae bacterium GWF2_49_21]HBC89553.1 hypothetical protein [Lentisphaeria bacterium]